MPFKSEKQRRYLWANEPEIARDWTDTYGSRIRKDNGGVMGWADQGGMKNYLGEQPMVNAPKNWRAGPDSPPTELAYITEPEKELILRSNMHGSLGQGPNEGPSGIMSLDSQGDYTRDRSPQGQQSSPGGPDRSRQGQAQHEQHMRNILTGQQNIGQTAAVSDRTRQHAVPEYARGPDGKMKYIGSGFKSAPSLFNPQGYRSIYNKRGLFGGPDIRFNQGAGEYQFKDPRTGNVKPGYTGRILGGLSSILTGIPFVGGAIGSAIDYGKGIFGQTPRDMSQFNRLGLYGKPGLEDFEQIEYYNRNKTPMDRIDPWTKQGITGTQVYDDYNYPDMDITALSKMLANPDQLYEEFGANELAETERDDLSEIEGQMSKVIGPALIQMRVLEKKKGRSEHGGPKLTPNEERILNELKEKDAEETVYKSIIT